MTPGQDEENADKALQLLERTNKRMGVLLLLGISTLLAAFVVSASQRPLDKFADLRKQRCQSSGWFLKFQSGYQLSYSDPDREDGQGPSTTANTLAKLVESTMQDLPSDSMLVVAQVAALENARSAVDNRSALLLVSVASLLVLMALTMIVVFVVALRRISGSRDKTKPDGVRAFVLLLLFTGLSTSVATGAVVFLFMNASAREIIESESRLMEAEFTEYCRNRGKGCE